MSILLTTGVLQQVRNLRLSKIKYGCLYNWFAVNSVYGLAPTGWHIATDAEFSTLRLYIASQGWNYDGTTDLGDMGSNKQGKALAAASGWTNSSSPGSVGNTDYPAKRNISGLSVLPGGVRNSSFNSIGTYCRFWTSTQTSAEYARNWYIINSITGFYQGNHAKMNGFSVRCMRDSATGWSEGETITDYDGNIYKTIKIGTQIWLVQNLATKHYKNGTAITNVTDNTAWAALTTEAYCAYANSESNVFL